jgi:putative heme degradation protein
MTINPIPLDGITYVSGAFQSAYQAKEATGWAPKGHVNVRNLEGPSTLHVFLTDASDVAALEEIVASANANEPMLKRQRARDRRVLREQAKFLARTSK